MPSSCPDSGRNLAIVAAEQGRGIAVVLLVRHAMAQLRFPDLLAVDLTARAMRRLETS